MPGNALRKIVTRAKQIFKKGGTWKGAIKKASVEYRSKKKKPARVGYAGYTRRKIKQVSKVARKKRKLNPKLSRKKAVASVSIGSVAHHKSEIRKGLKYQLEKKAGAREMSKIKVIRRKLSKDIAKIKKDIRALC
jgi:hypothetical protein